MREQVLSYKWVARHFSVPANFAKRWGLRGIGARMLWRAHAHAVRAARRGPARSHGLPARLATGLPTCAVLCRVLFKFAEQHRDKIRTTYVVSGWLKAGSGGGGGGGTAGGPPPGGW